MNEHDIFISLLNQEIAWTSSLENQKKCGISEEQANYYIRGLKQAKSFLYMVRPTIELITCQSGDWEVLRISGDDFEQEGHSVSNTDWIRLLNYLGYEVKTKCISDEEMENGDY